MLYLATEAVGDSRVDRKSAFSGTEPARALGRIAGNLEAAAWRRI
jgi:hypothetical protein